MKKKKINRGISDILEGKEERVVKDFKDKLLKRFKDKVVLIKIFGSRVRGEVKKNSDIDVLVVYKGNGRVRDSLLNIEWQILKKYDYSVYLSVVPYSFKEYEYDYRMQTPFIYNVDKEGVSLWDTVPKKKY